MAEKQKLEKQVWAQNQEQVKMHRVEKLIGLHQEIEKIGDKLKRELDFLERNKLLSEQRDMMRDKANLEREVQMQARDCSSALTQDHTREAERSRKEAREAKWRCQWSWFQDWIGGARRKARWEKGMQ